ncbi:MAG: flavin reductase family protein [Clostridia bacterium]|nr:flavin reductase family protein [Clostridia bacterium]
MSFKEISPYSLPDNPFKMIGKDWMLLTAEFDGKVNTMTASWGGVGILWNKPVAFIFVRPTRHTYKFIENSDYMSISILPEKYRKELNLCGTVSGRDVDKIKECGFSVSREENAPYFEEADTVFICKKHYGQMLNAESFVDAGFDEKMYADKNYHKVYIVEIEKILKK